MSDSNIEWTQKTWNPLVGCTKISAGCTNCYAETMSNRLRGMTIADEKLGKNAGRKSHHLRVINDRGRFNGRVELVPEALGDPMKWRAPVKVFVNSMSDLFHKDVPFEYIDKVFAVMALCPQHTFQILTKRPERMAEYLNDSRDMLGFKTDERVESEAKHIADGRGWGHGEIVAGRWPLPKVWLGTSIENQEAANERIPHLLRCPAAVRFLSVEPMLGPVDLTHITDGPDTGSGWTYRHWNALTNDNWCDCCDHIDNASTNPVNWVIVGGESGHNARPCSVEWIRSIVGQCKAARVPCFVKQYGSNPVFTSAVDPSHEIQINLKDKKGGDISEWELDLRIRQTPESGGGNAK